QAYQLKDGDLLYIDAYRIQVSIEQPARAKGKEVDPFELLKARSFDVQPEQTIAMSSSQDDHTASMVRHGEPAPAGRGVLPQQAVPVRGSAVSRGEAASRAGGDDLLRTTFAAAGIEGVEPSKQIAQTLGAVLRVAVGGLMDLLR